MSTGMFDRSVISSHGEHIFSIGTPEWLHPSTLMQTTDGPRVSVIIPVYGAEDWLHTCLKSIIDQTLRCIEIILVDDGSPDRSGLICDEFAQRDNRISVIHGTNIGPGGARQRGLTQARGEYIGFVDDDDYIEPKMFETMYAAARAYNADIVNCDHFSESPGMTKLVASRVEKNRVLKHEDVKRYYQDSSSNFEPFWFTWRNIYRREFLCKNELSFGLERGDDINFNLRAFFFADSIYALSMPLYHYVNNPSSLTRARFQAGLFDDLMVTYERRLEILKVLIGVQKAKARLNRYVIETWLPWLLRNARHCPEHDFFQRIKAIASDERIQEALHLYEPTGRLGPVMDAAVRLLRRGMYRTAWVILSAGLS